MGAGFLPFSRANFSLDLIAIVLAILLPMLTISIWAVRRRRAFQFHKRMQLTLTVLLLAAVILFELDIRSNGWRDAAKGSPYYEVWVAPVLVIHLLFSIPTLILWLYTVIFALKSFPQSVSPNRFSARHRKMGYLAVGGMYATAITGWMFYWLAFVS